MVYMFHQYFYSNIERNSPKSILQNRDYLQLKFNQQQLSLIYIQIYAIVERDTLLFCICLWIVPIISGGYFKYPKFAMK